MNTRAENPNFRFDGLKWVVVLILVIGAAWANAYFAEEVQLVYRAIALVLIGIIACLIALQTGKGYSFWTLLKESQVEVRKVVWPTTRETNQTTVLVSIVVIITALFLILIDWGIGYIAESIIG